MGRPPLLSLFAVCVTSVLASIADDATKSHILPLDGSQAKRWATRTAETHWREPSLIEERQQAHPPPHRFTSIMQAGSGSGKSSGSSSRSSSDYDSGDDGDLGTSSDEPDDTKTIGDASADDNHRTSIHPTSSSGCANGSNASNCANRTTLPALSLHTSHNHTNPNRSAEAGGEQGPSAWGGTDTMPDSLLNSSNDADANSSNDANAPSSASTSTTAPPNSSGRCDDTCEYAHDKSCDDGSDPDAERSGSAPTCELGTDCADCTAAAKHGKHHSTTARPTTTTTTAGSSSTAVFGSLTLHGLGPKAVTSTMQDALKEIIADEAPSARAKDVVLNIAGGHLFRRRRRLLEGGEEVGERGATDARGGSVTVDYEVKLADEAAAATTKANIKVS